MTITVHYFDRDDQLVSYSVDYDADGNVVSTSGIEPASNVTPATTGEIVAHLSRLLDARREIHDRVQQAAVEHHSTLAAEREAHRAALVAAGIPEDTALAMFPNPGEIEATPFATPPSAAEQYARYGLSEQEIAVVLQRRGA